MNYLSRSLTHALVCATLAAMYANADSTHTVIDMITVVEPPPDSPLAVIAEAAKVEYPPCTEEENTFALAVIECGGNIKAAYQMVYGVNAPMALSRGKELLARPQVALKIRDITDAIADSALISVGAHLHELAEIRDLAKASGQLKTALVAERTRGEAVGIYQKHDAAKNIKNQGNTNIQINVASKYDVSI